MSTDDLDALIVQNLRDLDAATKRLCFEIQPRVAKTINGIASNWAKQNKWIGEYDWWGEEDREEELWVAPPEWEPKNGNPAFYLDLGQGDDEGPSDDFFWLTRLCRSGNGLICLRWYDFLAKSIVRMACAVPGEQPSQFSEAIRLLGENAAYLYSAGENYWFSPIASLNQEADDRANPPRHRWAKCPYPRRGGKPAISP